MTQIGKTKEGRGVGYFPFFHRPRSCTSPARFAAGHLYNLPRRDNEDYAVVIILGGNQQWTGSDMGRK